MAKDLPSNLYYRHASKGRKRKKERTWRQLGEKIKMQLYWENATWLVLEHESQINVKPYRLMVAGNRISSILLRKVKIFSTAAKPLLFTSFFFAPPTKWRLQVSLRLIWLYFFHCIVWCILHSITMRCHRISLCYSRLGARPLILPHSRPSIPHKTHTLIQ